MFNPSIDDLVNKTGNRYKLCMVASKRARDLIIEECRKETENETFKYDKPLSIAIRQLLADEIKYEE